MSSVAGVVVWLVAVSCVSVTSFAQPTAPPPAAAPDGAASEEPPPAAAPAPPPKRKVWKEWLDREPLPPELEQEVAPIWYGWQTLLVDGLSMGVAVLTGNEAEAGLWLGVGALIIGSPIVHFAHLNVAHGFTSLALRLASAGIVSLGGTIIASNDAVSSGILIVALGLLGTVVAVVLDASVFAWEEPRGEQPRAWLTPWFDPEQGRVGLGCAASF